MWLAIVPKPPVPLDSLHKHLWGYFPDVGDGEPRPFLWREHEGGVALLSRQRPAAPALLIRPDAGRVYAFEAALKPANGRTEAGGKRREHVILGNAARKDWLARNCTGARLTFVEVYDRPDLVVTRSGGRRIVLPRCLARGTLQVVDRTLFTDFLCRGGPGTGKVYGLGLWWLPDLMAPALERLRRIAA